MNIATLPYDRPGVDAGPEDFAAAYMGGPPNYNYDARRGMPPGSNAVSDASSNSAFEFISYPFKCFNAGYHHVAEMAPGMLCFSVRQKIEPEPGSTVIMALPQVQKLMNDQWQDFVAATSGTSPDPEAMQFLQYMQNFGESILYSYDSVRNPTTQGFKGVSLEDKYGDDVRQYWSLARQSNYCYLTGFGIRKRINFLGVLIESNRGTTINEITGQDDYTDTSSLAIGIGRRIPTGQLFGPHDSVGIHCRLYVTLRRAYCGKGLYGGFELRPMCCNEIGFPSTSDLTYCDESGKRCRGSYWYVGYLLEPSDRPVSVVAIEQACNLGPIKNNMVALEAHGTVPTCWVCVGMK